MAGYDKQDGFRFRIVNWIVTYLAYQPMKYLSLNWLE